ncbi:hypothetical protein [Methylomarinovum caldicuralii]|uniref:hypothetical protein n=1 Tax=Methylomarinovum caldicuralii TaxID=438856 RepID=UPI0029558F48|nr:hypothetical protein [Methylomarinovum caldicuralii]
MQTGNKMSEGFRRLLWRRRFIGEEFQDPDRLNEYDEDYTALEEDGDAGDGSIRHDA